MHKRSVYTLRVIAATLVVFSGSARVASLWFRELDEQAVLALLVGAVYLITGIGLFGHSRFVLFFAVVACTTTALLATRDSTLAAMPPLQLASVLADGLTVLLCTLVLWQLGRQPDA